MLDEFSAPAVLRKRPIADLSGGWQRLALLARVWITRPDALLLDEPTNHLDGEKISLLEAWINGPAARTPMLMASHDRSFLDACTTRTLFLRPDVSRCMLTLTELPARCWRATMPPRTDGMPGKSPVCAAAPASGAMSASTAEATRCKRSRRC